MLHKCIWNKPSCCQSSPPVWEIQRSMCGSHVTNYLGISPVVSWSNVCLLTSLQLICEYFLFLFLTAWAWYAAFCKIKILSIIWLLHLSGNVFLNNSGNEMLRIHLWQTAAEHETAAAWSLQQPLINLEGQQKENHQHFNVSILPPALWECMMRHKNQDFIHFINKQQEESTRTISNLLQRHPEQIPAMQPIAVTVTRPSPPHKAIWLWVLSTAQRWLFERLANVSSQEWSSSEQLSRLGMWSENYH